MLIRLAALLVLSAVPPAVDAVESAPPPPKDSRAECMKTCAGDARSADGKHLLSCIRDCNVPDAGAPATPPQIPRG